MTRSLNFGNHLQVPHLLFFSQIAPLHLQRLLQLRISILFSTLPHHFCCLPPSPPSGQSLKQDWQSLQCFLLPYNSSVLVPILVALGPHWVPISLSGSLSIKISIHSLCSSICFLLSKNGICSRPRLMTILFHFLPSFFTLTIGKTVLETWHLRHWLQFWQLKTWIQTIILTWQLIVTLDSIRNSCDVFNQYLVQLFLFCLWMEWGKEEEAIEKIHKLNGVSWHGGRPPQVKSSKARHRSQLIRPPGGHLPPTSSP